MLQSFREFHESHCRGLFDFKRTCFRRLKSDRGPGATTNIIRSIITLNLHSKLLYFWPSVKKNLHLLEPKLSFAKPGFKSLKYSLDKISAEVKLYQVLPR